MSYFKIKHTDEGLYFKIKKIGKRSETFTAYFSSSKSPVNIDYSSYYNLYSESGSKLILEPEKSYLPTKYILDDESEVEIPSAEATKTYFALTSNQDPELSIFHTATNTLNGVVSLKYELQEANLITAWVSDDRSAQTVGPWSIRYLYDESGNQIPLPQGLIVVAYYYVNGEKIYNADLSVRMTDSGGRLQIGAKEDILIEKVEFNVQPVPTL